LGKTKEARMQIHGSPKRDLDIRKRLLQSLQLAGHIIFGVRRGKQQHGHHDDAPGASGNTGLNGLDKGRAGKFQVAMLQPMRPNALPHQSDQLLKLPQPIGVSTPMSSEYNGII
jgi:hypothetical protein